jgi:hypothetical protein
VIEEEEEELAQDDEEVAQVNQEEIQAVDEDREKELWRIKCEINFQ